MTIQNLHDLYIDQLKDLHSACEQSRPITEKMAEAASNDELRKALTSGAEGIQRGRDTLAKLCEAHGTSPKGEHCKGMEGLVTEARKHGLEADFGDDDTRDASIIAQYQRMAHYAIAGYGSVLAFARRLGHADDIPKLEECLESTRGGDRHMTGIAEGGVNRAAAG